MLFTATLGVLLWLLRDYPVIFALLLWISLWICPSLMLTYQFLEYERGLGRHLTTTAKFAAWLMALVTCVLLAPCILGIFAALMWLVGLF
jgi:hypothetical protein